MTGRLTATGKGGIGGTGAGARAARRGQRGVAYLIVLFLVALVGMGLAALGSVWQTEVQRDRERELLFIGEQFGVALWRYYEASPGTKEYPRRLEDLLDDRRHQVVRRHLRQIFVDPLTGKRDWVVVMVGGQITAVRSRSTGEPIVRSGFPFGWEGFADARTHAEWVFRALQPTAGPGAVSPLADASRTPADKTGVDAVHNNADDSPNSSDASPCEISRFADYATCQAGARADVTGKNAARRQQCIVSAAMRYGDCLQNGSSARPLLVP